MQALLIFLVAMTPKGEICEHADAILSKQLADGAIIHQQSGDQITISPYFGNYAALGLFEAYQITDDKKYLEGGIKWTDWYFKHMDLRGVIHDYKGTVSNYESTGECDATDSYAATFLMCVNMRRMLTQDHRFVLREMGKIFGAHKAMLSTLDVDGLTYAKPDSPYKYVMDNAEVFEALWHSRQIAQLLRDYAWVHEVYYTRRDMKKAFDQLRGEDGLYAWAKAGDATVTVEDTGEFYPAGLANLFVVALGPSEWHDRRDTVLATYRRFPNMTGLSPDQLYWWIVAAQRVGRKDIALQAFESMKAKVQERDLAVDHAFYLRAIASLKHAHTAPKRTKVMMGSTYIDIPRAAVR
ncbi:MAG TPA: hypothetical protein PLM14_12980 [Candidatus Hydrogenedentes bacterium]|nr:hypothetical protein [Candidatus Hydrogenedentota bacterium]